MERIRLHNLAASGTMYGTAIAASERMRINMQIYMGGALENKLVKYILDKLYIYSAPNYKDVSEFGKPIYDKWTIHRIFYGVQGNSHICNEQWTHSLHFFYSVIFVLYWITDYHSSTRFRWISFCQYS